MTRLRSAITGALLVSLSGCGLFTTKDQPLSVTAGDKIPLGTGLYVVSCSATNVENGIETQQIREYEVLLTENAEKNSYSYTLSIRDPRFKEKSEGPIKLALHKASTGIYILGLAGKPDGESLYFLSITETNLALLSFDTRSVEALAEKRGVVLARHPFSRDDWANGWDLKGDAEKERDFLLEVGNLAPLETEETKRPCSISLKP